MKTLTSTTFDKLIEKAICQTGDDSETIGFHSKYGCSEMSFYNDFDDLMVEDFGMMVSGKWLQMEATQQQKEAMRKLISDKYQELTKVEVNDAFTDDDYTHFRNLIYN